MARTGEERFRGAMQYIDNYISSDLHVRLQTVAQTMSQTDLGNAISLGGVGYWRHGSEDQHWAVRALLLCQIVFLKAPYSLGMHRQPIDRFISADVTKKHYLKQSEATVKNALKCYVPNPAPRRSDLVNAASNQTADESHADFQTLTRDIDPFPKMLVCFDAVRMWLFKSGFTSIPWLVHEGSQMTAQTANDMLGLGVEVDESELDTFTSGYMFNFHRKGNKAVCHWGISVGGGWAVASNTSAFAGAVDAQEPDIKVQFEPGGNTHYGKFKLLSSYKVCERKYRQVGVEDVAPMTIRKIDPTTVAGYF